MSVTSHHAVTVERAATARSSSVDALWAAGEYDKLDRLLSLSANLSLKTLIDVADDTVEGLGSDLAPSLGESEGVAYTSSAASIIS